MQQQATVTAFYPTCSYRTVTDFRHRLKASIIKLHAMRKILTIVSFFLFAALAVKAQTGNYLAQVRFYLNGKPYNAIQNQGIPVLEFFPGDSIQLVVTTHDPDNDSVNITSNFAAVFPGSTFNVTSARNPTAYFFWVPTNAYVSLVPVDFYLQVKDIHFPITGVQNMPYQIRVNKPGSIELNNGPVNLNQDIELEPGTPMNLKFSTLNLALLNAFSITSNVVSVLPGATFTADNANQQTANINFTPTAAQINSQPYTFTVTYQDNAPVPNQYVYTVNVKVRNAMLGTAKQVSELTRFSAFPNPFTDVVSFRIDQGNKAETILIYNLLGQQIDQINLPASNGNQSKVSWDKASLFAKGTYLARLVSKDKTIQHLKFIKQ